MNKNEKAENAREKWNLIHKFGVTRKGRKCFEINMDDKINPNSLNQHFSKLEPLPVGKYEFVDG